MRLNLFFILLFAFCGYAHSTIIKGQILSSEESYPLSYAHISINEQPFGYTNEDGEFNISIENEANCTIKISFLGYEDYNSQFTILENEIIDLGKIKMAKKSSLIDEVVITYPNKHFSNKFNGSNAIISKKDLDEIKPLSSEEVLKSVPGINISGDMGISNRLNVGIRGSYPRRSDNLLIMEDGTPIAPAPFLAPSAYYNPPADRLDGIEVIKGADILEYGGKTMYGAINYITKLPPVKPQLTIELTGGNNKLNSQYITYGGTWKNLSAEAQLLHKYFGGFQENTQSRITNATIKLVGELDKTQSIYLKFNFHHENSKATYSGITPLTFELDPTQNPFDADDLVTNRYAIDLAHKKTFNKNIDIKSKVFAYQFSRDWWRQNSSVVQGNNLAAYLGSDFTEDERYAYLNNVDFEASDYVRVGKVSDGNESVKARNRLFKVVGLKENLSWKKSNDKIENTLSGGISYHFEEFNNQEITNDSSRFARSGSIVKDEQFRLHTFAFHLKNEFKIQKFSLIPILRYEWVHLSKQDILSNALDPNYNGDRKYNLTINKFGQIIPGLNINYEILNNDLHQFVFFAGIYKGFNPPTASFGFLQVDDEEVSSVSEDETPNIKSEESINYELGLRGSLAKGILNFQSTFFNNHINNFYSAGRKEAFQSLGAVNLLGLETSLEFNPSQLENYNSNHKISVGFNLTYIKSKITDGQLNDSDLFKAKHTDETKAELIAKINSEPKGYNVYIGGEVHDDNTTLSIDDFDNIESIEIFFGDNQISNNQAPYVPNIVASANVQYQFKSLSVGLTLNYVSNQYTEYLNFKNETAEGALGELESYLNLDFSSKYRFNILKSNKVDYLEIFFTCKNLTNNIYKASRLHRVSSGIMPGGFRQFAGGIKFAI